jgi:hypothetical protein
MVGHAEEQVRAHTTTDIVTITEEQEITAIQPVLAVAAVMQREPTTSAMLAQTVVAIMFSMPLEHQVKVWPILAL